MEKILRLNTTVEMLSGVGKVKAKQLRQLGITTVRDLLMHFPRAYENRADVRLLGDFDTEASHAYILTIATEVSNARINNRMTIQKLRAFDDSGSCEIVFFNSPFVKDIFHKGDTFRFFGKTSFNKIRRLSMTSPKYEAVAPNVPLQNLVPVYPLTEGVSSKQLEKLIRAIINDALPSLDDPIPESIRLQFGLPTLSFSIKNIHFPSDADALASAQKRLAFDEMFYFALGVSLSAAKKDRTLGVRFSPCSLAPLTDILPYELTNAQKRVINDIYSDTVLKNKSETSLPAMARIVVGDVGSGKTVCAAAAMYLSVKSGHQCAMIVPTEILARQHFDDISKMLNRLGIKIELLIGAFSASKKERIYKKIAAHEVDIVIGTHALLSDKLEFASLGLIVTDEQHRFGVAQRGYLKDKVSTAHMLVMSATPIPRTLALVMYGDLDVSRIDEMPKGRTPIDTFVVDESYRERLNNFILKQVRLGGQCYVVCPAIEKSEDDTPLFTNSSQASEYGSDNYTLKNVDEYTEQLRKALPGISIESLHGKMKASDKDEIMSRFVSGDIKVLVSTTVIEVGVNVPNASLMIVENAECFGLSQLHQLRGRVGRGSRKSYCILVSDLKTEKSTARLSVMKNTNDGYEIAEKDLLIRGPGDFFSSISQNNIRQSGGLNFQFASIQSDTELFNIAFGAAKAIASADPDLTEEEHIPLRREVYSRLTKISDIS